MTFEQAGINTQGQTGQLKLLCPRCSHLRTKNPDEPCLSVNTETGVWNCHHCHWTGGNGEYKKLSYAERSYVLPTYTGWGLSSEAIDYFQKRGISSGTLELNQIGGKITKFSQKDEKEMLVMAFPYIKDRIVNVQYRAEDKRFKMTKDAEVGMWGFQNLVSDGQVMYDRLFITEGMIDALSLYEVGYQNSMSVPNGSPFEEEGAKPKNPSLDFLEDPDFVNLLSQVKEVVLVMDSDYQGRRLRDELAIKIGLERCYKIQYPNGCKDANDVLVKFGQDELIKCLLNLIPMVSGLCSVTELEDSLMQYYNEGLKGGLPTGIEELDSIFSIGTGQLITVTGTPESYKSVLMDNIIVNTARLHGTKSAIFSPESNPIQMHIGRLCSIHNGLPFGKAGDPNRMPYQEFRKSWEWINKHLVFIQPSSNTLREIIALWETSILLNDTQHFFLDPYGKLKGDKTNERQFANQVLNELGEFCVRRNKTVFLVAHSTKMLLEPKRYKDQPDEEREYAKVNPYDICGSSDFYNSSDCILSAKRSRFNKKSPPTIFVDKSKLWHIAKSGERVSLPYNFSNWRLGKEKINLEDLK